MISLKILTQKITDAIFPQFCLNCQREGQVVCDDCLSLIEINPWQFCPYCSMPQRVIVSGVCPRHLHQPLNGLFSAAPYHQPLIKKMIHAFKYQPYLKILARPLSQLMIAHFMVCKNKIVFHNQPNSLLVPVPLTAKKIRHRGYNQSQLLAEKISAWSNITLNNQLLIKEKETPSQVNLNKGQRQQNIKGAFAVNANQPSLKGKTIFVIDDVYTTGSTIQECAKVLKKAGAAKVYGIVVAREGLNPD